MIEVLDVDVELEEDSAERDARLNALAQKVVDVLSGNDVDDVLNVVAYVFADIAVKMSVDYDFPIRESFGLATQYIEDEVHKAAPSGVTLN